MTDITFTGTDSLDNGGPWDGTVMHPETARQPDRATAPVKAPKGLTLLERLEAEARRDAFSERVLIPVLRRQGWFLEFDGDLTYEALRGYDDRATPKRNGKPSGEVNSLHSNAFLLIERSTGIYVVKPGEDPTVAGNREAVLDGDGDPVTLRSREFVEMMTRGQVLQDSLAAVLAFLGEPGVFSAARDVMEFAGYNSETGAFVVDPTNA